MKKTQTILALLSGLLLIVGFLVVGTFKTPTALALAPLEADDDNCVTCHTSEETLKALAVEPEEEGEELSEGEG